MDDIILNKLLITVRSIIRKKEEEKKWNQSAPLPPVSASLFQEVGGPTLAGYSMPLQGYMSHTSIPCNNPYSSPQYNPLYSRL